MQQKEKKEKKGHEEHSDVSMKYLCLIILSPHMTTQMQVIINQNVI